MNKEEEKKDSGARIPKKNNFYVLHVSFVDTNVSFDDKFELKYYIKCH